MRRLAVFVNVLAVHFNPRIPHGMRRRPVCWRAWQLLISIHASRTGCDIPSMVYDETHVISIHASRTGCDIPSMVYDETHVISIHASRTGCDEQDGREIPVVEISIHASRTGCDSFPLSSYSGTLYFNPRIPHGMRHKLTRFSLNRKYFNPRIPHGMRHRSPCFCMIGTRFQSTHPARDATAIFRLKLPKNITIREKNRFQIENRSPKNVNYPKQIPKFRRNLVRIPRENHVRFTFAPRGFPLQNQRAFQIKGLFHSEMLYLALIIVAQLVKAKAVLFLVNQFQQL